MKAGKSQSKMSHAIQGGLIVFVAIMHLIQADYHSSIAGLENLLQFETFMVENLQSYIDEEKQRHSILRNLMDGVGMELSKAQENAEKYFGNPLNGWKTLKRFRREWQNLYQKKMDNKIGEEYFQRQNEYVSESSIRAPDIDDLLGAAKGIARLQSTYNLEAKHLAKGTILGRKFGLEMRAADCFDLGVSLIRSGEHEKGEKWLLEARARLAERTYSPIKGSEFRFPYLQDREILDNLIPVAIENGNTKTALWLVLEELARNPGNHIAGKFKELIEKKLRTERYSIEIKPLEQKKKEKPMTLMEMYEKTCRGEMKPKASEQRKLHCNYTHHNVPFCLIAPFKLEVLSIDPYIAVYYEAIYESEIQTVLKKVAKTIERSKVGIVESSSIVSEHRTSQQAWLYHEHNEFLKPISQRLMDITGLSISSAEAMQVVNYGIGGHYGPHYDFSEEKFDAYGTGNRILTALFYINEVEFGGETAFPYLGIAVPPIKRSLAVWYNLHRSSRCDYRTMHGGCPVLKGSKWILNEWFHERDQEFRRPCAIEPDHHISDAFQGIGLKFS